MSRVMIVFAALLPLLAWSLDIAVNPMQRTGSFSGRDDVAQLRKLTLAVGWEFTPDAETTAALKRLGVGRLRCINVEQLPGAFDAEGNYRIDDSKPSRLDAHLATAKEIGAVPHIIVGQGIPKQLRRTITAESDEAKVMGLTRNASVGPTDYTLYRNYYVALFEHILLKKEATNAVFEAFNEPDIGGAVSPVAPVPALGSARMYEGTFKLYREISAAAKIVEARNPGLKVVLGGPALAWAYTYRYGSFNWSEQFMRDCAREKLKLDFIGLHFYGNTTSINGEYKTAFPSFVEMLAALKKVRDEELPGLPIQFNEWGPSYHVNLNAAAMVNADHIGTAWSMEFLKTMLEQGVDEAMYLVTTDNVQKKDDKLVDVWGWCALFTNPQIYGKAYPKSIFNLFEMISSLQGYRVESSRNGAVNTFAAANPEKRKLSIIVWNFRARLPENAPAIEEGVTEMMELNVKQAKQFFQTDQVRFTRKMISEKHANAYGANLRNEVLSAENTGLQINNEGKVDISGGTFFAKLELPPSSVSLIEIEAVDK